MFRHFRPSAWLVALILLNLSSASFYPVATAKTIDVDSIDALSDAVRKASPGDEVVLADGEYRDVELRIFGKGEKDRPILVRAQTVGGVKITGESNMRIWGQFVTVRGFKFINGHPGTTDVVQFRRNSDDHATGCRLTRCSIIDFNPPDGKSGKWVSVYGQDNRVDHCYIAGKTTEGATLVVWLDGKPNHHRIDHNHFGPRPPLGRNGGETIRIGASDFSMTSSATIVEDNLFDECDGEIEVISNKSFDNIYRNNTFDNCDGTLTLRHGGHCRVINNVFIGRDKKSSGGVRIIGPDHTVQGNHMQKLTGKDFFAALSIMNGQPDNELTGYQRVENPDVAGNVIIDCVNPLSIGTGAGDRGRTLAPKNVKLIENLIVNSDGDGKYIIHAKPQGLVSRDNHVAGSTPPPLLNARTYKAIVIKDNGQGLLMPTDNETLSQYGYGPKRLTPEDVGPDAP